MSISSCTGSGPASKKICVIGAGVSGLAAIKSCKEAGLDVVCYERSDNYGGLWRYSEDDVTGRSSVMRTTIINTSKEMTAFSDFPPPDRFANFMHHSYLLDYISSYAHHFDLTRHIRYRQEVSSLRMAMDYEQTGKWDVTVFDLDSGQQETVTYDGVMVCVGHHALPNIPSIPGLSDFQGSVVHSRSLKYGDGYLNKKVLVVGGSNSAVDAATEICRFCKNFYFSSHRGCWIFSRLGLRGKPYDIQTQTRVFETLRLWNILHIADSFLECLLSIKLDHAAFRLRPKHRVLEGIPTVSDDFPACILSGKVTVKGNVKEFVEKGVIFEGEDEITEIDAVVLATGYEISFPFIPESIFQVNESTVNLYKLMFPPHLSHASLVFVGMVQPIGPLPPVAEAQSRWYVQLMLGNRRLPSSSTMQEEINARKGNSTSTRHFVQVWWISYMDDICLQFGSKPSLWRLALEDPRLAWACLSGPCVPYQYRLQGPNKWSGARDAILSVYNRIDSALNTCKR